VESMWKFSPVREKLLEFHITSIVFQTFDFVVVLILFVLMVLMLSIRTLNMPPLGKGS
jgi:hypothetical protein